MAKTQLLSDQEIKFLRALSKHQVEFMMVGLSAAALQGAPVVTQDIEIPIKNFKVKTLRLDRIIKSKETANRPKDQIVLPILKDTWKTIKKLKS